MSPHLFELGTRLGLRLLGGREGRRSIGPWSVLVHRLGREGAEPWVLLHGLGATGLTWAPVLRGLAAGTRLVVPELSRLGGTRGPVAALDVAGAVPVVAALVAAEFEGRPVTVAGVSLGGWVAVRLALARPDLVRRLVLIDSGGYRDQDWDAIRQLVEVRDRAGAEALLDALFRRPPGPRPLARRVLRAAYTSSSVREVLASLSEDDVFDDDDLGRIEVPAAVVWGERDGLFRLAVGERMARALPRGSFYPLTGCGHVAQWDGPRALLAAVQAFRDATREAT